MSFPNSNIQQYNGPLPVLRNQNTPQETWKADRKMWKAYDKLDWVINQQLEPNMPHNGRSIFLQWLNEVEVEEGNSWVCRVPLDVELGWCDHRPFRRLDRAIAHVRKHLDFKPFACGGRCGNERCDQRFHSSEKFSAHRRGPDHRPCNLCGEIELRQNMARHKADNCINKPPQAEEAT